MASCSEVLKCTGKPRNFLPRLAGNLSALTLKAPILFSSSCHLWAWSSRYFLCSAVSTLSGPKNGEPWVFHCLGHRICSTKFSQARMPSMACGSCAAGSSASRRSLSFVTPSLSGSTCIHSSWISKNLPSCSKSSLWSCSNIVSTPFFERCSSTFCIISMSSSLRRCSTMAPLSGGGTETSGVIGRKSSFWSFLISGCHFLRFFFADSGAPLPAAPAAAFWPAGGSSSSSSSSKS
mmetsp:Transcript_57268/g.162580  ORF Transcript_57268/g.162580 Transcript_57268/m.162580 type:complete len:235 (+) Transcript_57268:257-961(+)